MGVFFCPWGGLSSCFLSQSSRGSLDYRLHVQVKTLTLLPHPPNPQHLHWHQKQNSIRKRIFEVACFLWSQSWGQIHVHKVATARNWRSSKVEPKQSAQTFTTNWKRIVCLFVGCLTSQQQASVSQGRICSDNFTCCHTEIEVADQTFYLNQSQYTNTGPTNQSTDPITPGTYQGSHWSANFLVTGINRPRKNPVASGIRTQDLSLSRREPYH